MKSVMNTTWGALLLLLILLPESSQAFQSTPLSRISHYHHQYQYTSNTVGQSYTHDPYLPRSQSPTALQAASPLTVLSSPAGSLAILAGIILVHESGHYLAARALGMEVEEFAIGFGPKVVGFNALGNDFTIRALPLGGYVRFPENYNATLVQDLENQAYEEAVKQQAQQEQQSTTQTLGFRMANFISGGRLERQRIQDAVQAAQDRLQELPPWKQAEARKERALEPVAIPYDDNPNLLQNRPWTERAIVISGGVIFNILLSFSIYFSQIGGPVGIPSPVFEPGVKVGSISQATAAAKGVLKSGDVILQANGAPLTTSSSPTVFEAQKGINDLISIIRATPDGDALELSIIRNEKGQEVENIQITPKRAATSSGPQTIGVMLTPNYIKSQNLRSDNPVEAAKLAFGYTKTLTMETANGLWKYLSQSFSGGSNGGGAQVSGPIGLIREGSKVVETKDLQTVLLFAAAISINLGVVNAFPLPALDGGQLVFVLLEAVTRRKIDQKVQEGINGAAVLILLLVSAEAAIGDIFKLFN